MTDGGFYTKGLIEYLTFSVPIIRSPKTSKYHVL